MVAVPPVDFIILLYELDQRDDSLRIQIIINHHPCFHMPGHLANDRNEITFNQLVFQRFKSP